MGSMVGAWRRPRDLSGQPSSSTLLDKIGPAELNTRQVIDEYAATVRGAAALFAAVVGLAAMPISPWQRPICIGVLAWALVRLSRRKRRAGTGTVVIDLIFGCAVGLAAPLTTSLPDLAAMRGFAVNVVNPISLTLAWYRRRGIAIVLFSSVLGCYLAGLSAASGLPLWAEPATYVLPVQSALSWTLVGIFLPAARSADAVAARRAATAIELEVAAARRAAEREHWAVMHDTAASTLLMVGDGVPAIANERIRRQAARDLETVGGYADGASEPFADLGAAVRQLVSNSQLSIQSTVDDVAAVPALVVAAAVGATRELLTNVERHAETTRAAVDLIATGNGFELSVRDGGAGFRPTDLGRGLKVSVQERMHRVGGRVRIESVIGQGSTVTISWSRP